MYGFEKDIDAIKSWLKTNKVSPSCLGFAACKIPSATGRVLEGASTVKTLKKVMKHITKYPKVKNPSKAK